ncbi:MAG TPA: C39 family peptidase [Candidatus Saccharimonadales bacterium]
MSVKHDIPLKTQTTSSNCVQTSTSQFLSFYEINISPEDIEKDIPVRTNSEDKPMGTLLADIGTWFIKSYGLKAKMHVFDVQIIDRTWSSLSQSELLTEMKKVQEEGISTALSPLSAILIDAYVKYLESGGLIDIAKCTNKLLQELLDKGPVIAIISFNYMYDYPRLSYDKSIKNYVPDTIDGKVVEHAIVLTGYENGTYLYNDPDAEKGGQHQVDEDILIGAICTSQINSDNYLLSVEKV